MHGDLCKHLGLDSSTDRIPTFDLYWNLFLNKGTRVVTTIFIDFSDPQGQLTPKAKKTEESLNPKETAKSLGAVTAVKPQWPGFQLD